MTTKEHIAAQDLAAVDIFSDLSHQDLELLAGVCTIREYQPGKHCAVQNEPTDEIQIVSSGKVAIEMQIEVAPYSQTLNLANLTEGSVFNWSCLVESDRHDISSRCIGQTRIICIKAADLLQILKENTWWFFSFHKRIAFSIRPFSLSSSSIFCLNSPLKLNFKDMSIL